MAILRRLLLLLALCLPTFAVAAQTFQCVIAAGSAIVSDPIPPQFGTIQTPPTYRLFDGGVQVASGNLIDSSTITQGNPQCYPAQTPYNPGPAGSWAFRTGTGPLAVGSTHTYTAIITNNLPTTLTPPLAAVPGPLTQALIIQVVAVLPVVTAPPAVLLTPRL